MGFFKLLTIRLRDRRVFSYSVFSYATLLLFM